MSFGVTSCPKLTGGLYASRNRQTPVDLHVAGGDDSSTYIAQQGALCASLKNKPTGRQTRRVVPCSLDRWHDGYEIQVQSYLLNSGG